MRAHSSTSSPPDPQRILVIKLRELGDVLLTTPVFTALRERFPKAEIIACVYSGTEVMLQGHPAIDRILTFPKRKKPLPRSWIARLRFFRALRQAAPDLALELTRSDSGVSISRLSGASIRAGHINHKGFLGRNQLLTHPIKRVHNQHTVLENLRVLEAIGIHAQNPRLCFHPGPDARSSLDSLLPSGPLIHVHAVSRLFRKHWPIPYWSKLLQALAERGFRPVLTCSPDPHERKWVSDLLAVAPPETIDLSARLSLHQLGALSERAAFFLGVDSAPMHLAAAVGAPVIAFFGPSSETLWSPWCEHKLILSQPMPCRLPCKDKACAHINCLNTLTPEMVLPKIDAFLRSLAIPA